MPIANQVTEITRTVEAGTEAANSRNNNDKINNKNGRKDTAKKDRNSPVINIRSHLSRISKMTNILLSAPNKKCSLFINRDYIYML